MKKALQIVGREREIPQLEKALSLGRNVLIEGPVGVGKTFLVLQLLKKMKRETVRVDGDTRYTEQKLTGWFDPPLVLKKGYVKECFIDGPLVEAMRGGKILFVNELNRMPEAVQNILLPAMDERQIVLPKIGMIQAKPGFAVVATQNPREFTATHALSEALLDRFEMIKLEYQNRDEEMAILKQECEGVKSDVLSRALDLVRATRQHPQIKRGASLRAAIALCKLVEGDVDFKTAALMAVPSRIEMVSPEEDPRDIILALLANHSFPQVDEKKKELRP